MKSQEMELVGNRRGIASQQEPPETFNIEQLFRYAIDKGLSAEAMKDLMSIRRELNSESAKRAFDEALGAFQANCPVIQKRKSVMNKDGRSLRYKYAPLDDIVTQVKELLNTHGFSYSLTTETDKNCVKAVCKLKHNKGHSELSEFQVPIDPQAFMNEQQKFASALTFAKRYAFCNSLGILTGDEDTDSNTQARKPSDSGRVITADTRNRFFDLTKDIHVKMQAMAIDLGWIMPDQSLDEIPDEHLPITKAELAAFRQRVEAHK